MDILHDMIEHYRKDSIMDLVFCLGVEAVGSGGSRSS